MAGIKHPTINMKCVVFAMIIIALFRYCPTTQMSPLYTYALFFVSYVAMAWYDHIYECQRGLLQQGTGPTSLFKPEQSSETDCDFNRKIINYSHILFIAPLIMLVGLKGLTPNSTTAYLLMFLATATVLYHSYVLM